MSGGELRQRVEFQARGATDDDAGNVEGDFIVRFVVAAAIIPRLGGEEVMAARLAGRQPVTIRIRYSSQSAQIETDWRVRDVRADVLYNIRAVSNPDQKRQYLDLLCEAGVAT